jgi:hypothetical protein
MAMSSFLSGLSARTLLTHLSSGAASCFLSLGLLLGCGGSQASSAPTITSFTPSSGLVGATVTVTGTNFTAGISSVTLGGVAADSSTGTISSDTTLSFLVPDAAITGPITIEGTGGTAVSGTDFIVEPSITTVSPRTGSASAGTVVTVSGYGLEGITAISFGTAQATITSQSANTIVTAVPADAVAGSVKITFTVDSSYGLSNLLSSFTVTL